MREFNCPDCNYTANSCKECFRFKNYIKQSNIEKENKENVKEDSTDIKTTEIKINYIPVSYPTCPFLTNYPYYLYYPYPYYPYYPDYYFDTSTSAIPPSCRYCPNHPSNGGTGICNCILGTPTVY